MSDRISYFDTAEFNPEPEPVRVGDTVKTGPNDYPRFKVIAIDSGRTWLRNVISGEDAIVSLEDCCWRVTEGEGPDERVGRVRGEQSAGAPAGHKSPAEPARIDQPPEASPSGSGTSRS